MKLSSFTTTVLFTFVACVVAVLYAPAGHTRGTGHHYPICSGVAHQVQESWQLGELTRAEAEEEIIDSCIAWEDKQ